MKKYFSPSKSRVKREIQQRENKEKNKISPCKKTDSNRYFCHYNNGVYMGGMNAYKKHGKGILLHDDGSSVITDYLHDIPTGHSIIFREHSISSVLHKNNIQYQIAYKVSRSIIKISFNASSNIVQGTGVLIDFEHFKIYQLIYQKGKLIEKRLHLNKKDNQDVFNNNSIAKIIGIKHERALQFIFDKPQDIQIKFDKKRMTIGFFDNNGEIHGLAFRNYIENTEVSSKNPFYQKNLERGYYKNSRLETFGQKYFTNGNRYIGEFYHGKFHGMGVLISPCEFKWIFGKFYQGKLDKILVSNNKTYTENQFKIWNQLLKEIHQRYRQRWIDLDIQLPEQIVMYNLLKEANHMNEVEIKPNYNDLLKQKDQLQRIQNYFVQANSNVKSLSLEDELNRQYFINTFDKQKKYTSLKQVSNIYQKEYIMEDPFKIQYINMNSAERSNIFKEDIIHKNKIDTYNVGKKYLQKYIPEGIERIKCQQNNKYSITNKTPKRDYEQQQNKQRYKLNKLPYEDQAFQDRKRKMFGSSPIHPNYYNSTSLYSDRQSIEKRYGHFTNKRHFDYTDPDDYAINKSTHIQNSHINRNYNYQYPNHHSSYHHQSPKNNLKSNLPANHSPYKISPHTKYESHHRSSNSFIQNNYKYLGN